MLVELISSCLWKYLTIGIDIVSIFADVESNEIMIANFETPFLGFFPIRINDCLAYEHYCRMNAFTSLAFDRFHFMQIDFHLLLYSSLFSNA